MYWGNDQNFAVWFLANSLLLGIEFYLDSFFGGGRTFIQPWTKQWDWTLIMGVGSRGKVTVKTKMVNIRDMMRAKLGSVRVKRE